MELLTKLFRSRYCRLGVACFLVCFLFFNGLVSDVIAGPEGAKIVNGQVAIQQSGSNTAITASDKAIINYSSFNIAQPETVRFIQPGSSASVLNRILSANPTNINGTLLANGRVFFVNPAGVYIGAGARINVNQLVASGLNISNADFINGRYNFVGGNGSVINSGDIRAEQVYLIGKQVVNSGNISCPAGYVVMASGDRVFLGEPGSDIVLEVDAPSLSEPVDAAGTGTAVLNEGTIEAAGGIIALAAAGDIYSQAISNVGTISASTESGKAGNVKLTATEGTVINSGSIEAKSSSGTGGNVQMLGDRVGLFDAGRIDVSGSEGGGTVLVGGDYQGKGDVLTASLTYVGPDSSIIADATENGDGGKVIVWADEITRFYGDISARGGTEAGDGGFVEVSGKENLGFYGYVDTQAPMGDNGTLLLDPTNLTITDAASGGGLDASLGDILFGEGNPDDSVSAGALEDLPAATDIILQATNSITIDPLTVGGKGGTDKELTLGQTGDVKFLTGAGGFSMAADNKINVTGTANLTIDAIAATSGGTGNGPVSLGELQTASGNITVNGTTVTLNDNLTAGNTLSGNAATINVQSNAAQIQDAIDVAASGATVTVGDGTYTEDLTVDKSNLKLQSVNGRGLTTIQLVDGVGINIGTGGSGFILGGDVDVDPAVGVGNGFKIKDDSSATTFNIQLTNAPSDVEISWNTIDTSGSATMGISVGDAGAAGLNINNNDLIAGDGDGAIWGPIVSGATVSNNDFTVDSGTPGYAIQFSGLSNSTISQNKITDYGQGISVFHGEGVSNVTIEENVITGCTNGIRFGEYKATGGLDGSITSVTVRNNTVTGGTNAIRLHPDGSNVSANGIIVYDNDLSGNTYGVKNEFTSGTLDASDNWWGSANGPTIASNTFNFGSQGVQIDEAVADNVKYVQWWDSGGDDGDPDNGFQPTGGSLFAPVTNITHDPDTYYSSIGSGISSATANNTLLIENGTFSEAPTVDKNLTLTVPIGTAEMTRLISNGSTTTGLSGLFAANTSTDPAFQFGGAVTLAGDVTLTSTNQKAITFNSTIDGDQKLTVNTGTGGTATFGDMVGNANALSGLEVDALNVDFDNTVEVDDDGIDIDAGGYVTFDNTVDTTGGGTVTISNTGLLTISGPMSLDGAFNQDGAGAVSIAGDVDTTNDNVTFTNSVTLGSNVDIDTTGTTAGNILFSSTINTVGNSLALDAGSVGNITLSDALTGGGDVTVRDGAVQSYQDLTLNSLSIQDATTSVTFGGDVAATTSIDVVSGGTIIQNGSVTSGTDLVYDAAGDLALYGTTTVANSAALSAGNNLTVGASLTGGGALTLIATGGAISGSGTIQANDGVDTQGDLTLWQGNSLNLANLTFGNQSTTDLTAQSYNGGVTIDKTKPSNAADQWQSIIATAEHNVVLSGDGDITTGNLVSNGAGYGVQISTGSGGSLDAQGTINSGGFVDVDVEGNAGFADAVTAGDDIDLAAGGSLDAQGTIDAGGSVTVDVEGDAGFADAMTAVGNIDLAAGGLDVQGAIDSGGLVTVDVVGDASFADAVTAVGNIDLAAGGLDVQGAIDSGGLVTVNVVGDASFADAMTAVGNIDLAAGSLAAQSTINSGGSVTANIDGQASFADAVTAGDDIDLVAGGDITTNAMTSTAGDIDITSTGGNLVAQGTINSGGSVTANIDGQAGFAQTVSAGSGIDLDAGDDITTRAMTSTGGNIEIESAAGDLVVNGALTADAGGVSLISETGTIYTPGGSNDTLNVPITGFSNSAAGTGVDLPFGSGKTAILIENGSNLILGPGATLTANGTYNPASYDDRESVDFDSSLTGGGEQLDVAIYLGNSPQAPPIGNITVNSIVVMENNGGMVVDAGEKVLFGDEFGDSEFNQTHRLEVVSRLSKTLSEVASYERLPFADNPEAIRNWFTAPGYFAGAYVLRGVRTLLAEVLAVTNPVPLVPPRTLEPELRGEVEGPDTEALARLLTELGIGVQPYMTDAYGGSLSTDLRLYKAAEKLQELMPILEDADGTRIAGLKTAVQQFFPTLDLLTEEQVDSFDKILQSHKGDMTDFDLAGQCIYSLTEYVNILGTEIGWPVEKSVNFVMGRYVPRLTEGDEIRIAVIQMFLQKEL